MRIPSKFLTIAAALVGLLLIPMAALAGNGYAPDVPPETNCVAGGDTDLDCVSVPWDPGTEFTAEGYHDGGDVAAIAMGTTLALTGQTKFDETSGTINEDGEAVFELDASSVPAGAEITVVVSGIRNGEPVTDADEVATVEEDGTVIANAGSDAGLLAMGAVGAIALGGAALFISRRKRTTSVA